MWSVSVLRKIYCAVKKGKGGLDAPLIGFSPKNGFFIFATSQ